MANRVVIQEKRTHKGGGVPTSPRGRNNGLCNKWEKDPSTKQGHNSRKQKKIGGSIELTRINRSNRHAILSSDVLFGPARKAASITHAQAIA